MADWRDAVQQVPGGVRLLVEVAAGAKQSRFPDGFNPWRDGRLGVRVRAQALEGRANDEVVSLVAAFLGGAAVTIESGPADARKTLVARGITRAAIVQALEAVLGPA